MKKSIVFVLVLSAINFAQQASTYFPATTGYRWYYESTPLDSVQQPIDSLKYYQQDSLAGEGNYLGVTAKYLVSKTGSAATIPYTPYLDTTYLNFNGTEAKEYFEIPNIDTIAAMMTRWGLDTMFSGFNIINTFKSFEKWYTMYKFSSSVNASYQIFQYDTTVTIDSLNLPLRFLLKGKRLADKSLNTQIGTFTCKVFLMEFSMNYLVVIPPFPAVAIPLLTIGDSVYIAPNQWHVRRVAPSTSMNLAQLGLGAYTIPGRLTEAIPAIPTVGIDRDPLRVNTDYLLVQNYPNPFNPGTTIRYTLPANGRVRVSVVNPVGEEVQVLRETEDTAGEHEVYWNAAQMPSGVYFVQLQTAAGKKMQKMLLLK